MTEWSGKECIALEKYIFRLDTTNLKAKWLFKNLKEQPGIIPYRLQ